LEDVNGLIVTGIGHNSTAAGSPRSLTDFYPASLDPEFITDLSTLGYLTTLPGHRVHAFIGAGTIEQGMSAVEESTMKDTLSPVELVTLILDTSDVSKLTFGIRAPVLYALVARTRRGRHMADTLALSNVCLVEWESWRSGTEIRSPASWRRKSPGSVG